MQQNGELARHGDDGAFLGRLAAAAGEREAMSPQVAVGAEGSEDVVRRLHEQLAQEGVAFLGDVHLRVAIARLAGAGRESEIGAHSSAVWEAGGIFEGQDVGERSEWADAGDLVAAPRFRRGGR